MGIADDMPKTKPSFPTTWVTWRRLAPGFNLLESCPNLLLRFATPTRTGNTQWLEENLENG